MCRWYVNLKSADISYNQSTTYSVHSLKYRQNVQADAQMDKCRDEQINKKQVAHLPLDAQSFFDTSPLKN